MLNEAYCRMSGYSESELLNMHIADLEALETHEMVAEHMDSLILKGMDRFESKHRRKDGTVFDVEVSTLYRSGESDQCVCFLRDITQQKIAQEALRKERDYAQHLLNTVQAIIVVLDREGRITLINPKGCHLLGYDASELIGRNWFEKVLPQSEAYENVYPVFLKIISGEIQGAEYFDNPVLTRNGELRHIAWHNTTMHDANGLIIGILSAGEDITDRKQLESQLLNAIDLAKLAPWEYDSQSNIFTFNDQFYKLFHTTAEEIGGYSMSSADYAQRFVHPEDRHLVGDEIRAGIETSDPDFNRQLDHRIIYADGQIGYISVRYFIVKDSQGGTVRFYGVNQDITEQKKAFEKIQQANDKMKLAADSACFGIWDYRVKENRLEWDDWMFRLYGVNKKSFSGAYDAWQMGVHPDDRERMDQEVKLALRREKEFDAQFRIVRPDGQVRLLKAHASVSRDSDGIPVHMTGVNYDITDQVNAIEALKESEERFKTLHNASFGGIAIHDKGVILECNKGLSEITGYDYDELIGMNGLLLISDDTRAMVVKNIEAGYEKPYEAQGVRKNGELYPLRLEARNIPFKGKNVRVVEFRDITENKRAEGLREELEAKLHQAQKMEAIGTLAGGIAHDFNNILGAVLGYAEMAKEDSEPGSRASDKLDRVIEAGNRAAGLVKQILAFSRQVASEPVPLNPQHVIREAIKLLRPSLPSTITIKQQLASPINTIIADPTQIHQLVMNLCTNAFQAMEQFGGILSISLENQELADQDIQQYPDVKAGKFVVLTVSDTGTGISPELRERIFEPFFTTKEVGKGTGMGLAIVHGVASSLGGFVTCESILGQGTVFRVYLPAALSDVIESSSVSTDVTPTGSEHVLFVDDEEVLAELGQIMLEHIGYNVTTCTDSMVALSLIQENPGKFDILVTDQTMPKMTGFELAIKVLKIRPNLPIILSSGYSNIIDEEAVQQAGIRGFLMKPVTKKALAELLAEVKSENISKA
jgi:PAS domain S-box-containing protein